MVAAVQGKGQIHLCSFVFFLCHSSVSRVKCFSLPMVFLSSATCLRHTGQQVKSIIPLAEEIFAAIWNKCFAQVSLQKKNHFQRADGRSRTHNSDNLSSATSAPAVIASFPYNIRVNGWNNRKACFYIPKLWIDVIVWLIWNCESEYLCVGSKWKKNSM